MTGVYVTLSGLVRIEISQIEDKVVPVLKRYEQIAGAYLFGSALDMCRPDSDIDIGLLLMPGQVESEKDYDLIEARIFRDLPPLNGHPIDLVFLDQQNAIFSYKVIKNGKLIFSRDLNTITDFIESVSIRYRVAYPRYRQALEMIAMGESK